MAEQNRENVPALSPTDAGDVKQERRQRKWHVFWLKMAAVPLLIGIVAWVVFCRSVPPRIVPETTRITEPRLEKRHGVDYYKAIRQRMHPLPMDSDDNGFRLLARHLPLPELPLEKRIAVYRQLGLNEKTVPDMRFEEHYDYLWRIDHLLAEGEWYDIERRLSNLPWTLDEYPFMQKWLEDNEDALNLLREVARKPYFYVPFVKDEETSIFEELLNEGNDYYYHAFLRNYTRALHARANYYIGTGDFDAAVEDRMTIARLGRFGALGIGVTPGLVGLAIEGIGDMIGICANPDAMPTREQLQRLLDEYQNLPPFVPLETLLENERLQTLDLVQSFYLYGFDMKVLEALPGAVVPDWVNYVNLLGFDFNHAMREVNEAFDTGTADPFNPTRSDLFSLRRRSQQMANAIIHLSAGTSQEPLKEAFRRRQCTINMQVIVLAMLIYHEDHGTLPPAFTVDESGRPLQSWRVLLLPYLGHEELHAKIRLDEPWDSEYNRRFHGETPAVYRCPSMTLADGETSYTVVIGAETAFNDSGTGRKLSDFGPKSGDLILLGEMPTPICWMSPHDLTWERAKSRDDGDRSRHVSEFFGSVVHVGGCNFAFRNGGVRFISSTINNEKWNGMLLGVQLEEDDAVALILNTPSGKDARTNEGRIRAAEAASIAMEAMHQGELNVESIQDRFKD